MPGQPVDGASVSNLLAFSDIFENGNTLKEIFWRNIANAISILRAFGALVIHVMMLSEIISYFLLGNGCWQTGTRNYILLILSLCMISDFVDGEIARYVKRVFKFESKWGKILDPLADKMLMVPTICFMTIFFFFIGFRHRQPLAFFIVASSALLIALELTLARWGWKAFKMGLRIGANWYGKRKMNFECLFAPYFLIGFLFPGSYWMFDPQSNIFMWIILSLTSISAILAMLSIAGHLRQNKELVFNGHK